jgi:hypothetical protein
MIISQVKLISMNRLATYANTCKGNTCKIIDYHQTLTTKKPTTTSIFSTNNYEDPILGVNTASKLHSYLRVWQIF